MIFLSEEWALLSRAMYEQDFIDELADFLKQNNIETILECGCGDGNVLQGLAKKGFKGLGIDSDIEMIKRALQYSKYRGINYKQMDWLNIKKLNKKFDCIIYRGNSLIWVNNWNKNTFDPNEIKNNIQNSIGLFFSKLNQNGLLYLDIITQKEINNKGGSISFRGGNVNLKGKIIYDWSNKIRIMYGKGKVKGEDFCGCSISYLMTPDELESMIKNFNPSRIFRPKLKYEKMYNVICAIK